MTTLAHAFRDTYTITLADTPARRDLAYRLRYEVYCATLPGFVAADYPDGRETDDDDARATIALIHHRPSGVLAATCRLIHHRSGALFPVERYMDHRFPDARARTAAEISRYVIAPAFRSWRGPVPPFLGLVHATLSLARASGVRSYYAAMDDHLDARFRQFGVHFEPITAVFDYHGPVRAYVADVDALLARCHDERPEVWEAVRPPDAPGPARGLDQPTWP